MNRILELAGVLQEAAEAKLYIVNAYGNGYDRKAVKKGEMLTQENGDECEFVRLDGNKVVLKHKDGKEHKVSLKNVGGKVLAAGQKADKAFFESLNEANKIVEPKKFAKDLADVSLSKAEALKKIADDSGLEDVIGMDKDWKKFEKALAKAYEAGMKSNDE